MSNRNKNSTISLRTSIISHLYWGNRKDDHKGSIEIGRNVFIGPHCVILPNVIIGEGAVIKAGTIVSRNVPPFTFWGDASSGPLAHITTPLISSNSYSQFLYGLKPIKRNHKINLGSNNFELKS